MNIYEPDLIYTHPTSGGSLHQSGIVEIPYVGRSLNLFGWVDCELVAKGLSQLGFQTIALTAKGFQPELEKAGFNVLHLPFEDSEALSLKDIAEIEQHIEKASSALAEAILKGEKVLSTCAAGINRSSLLSAFTLKKLDKDLGAGQIVDLIRLRRSSRALNNKLFELFVLQGFTSD